MANPFIGQIVMFGGNFAPRNWAFCDGQLLAIAQNTALFSILGTTYGGDGRTTFGLPRLRGRVPIHAGRGPGLSDFRLGQSGGAEQTFHNLTTLPSHNHGGTAATTVSFHTHDDDATSDEVDGNFLANVIGGGQAYSSGPADGTMNAGAVTATTTLATQGNNQPVNNLMPYATVNYIIALFGTFPSRS